jgi:hypothetical protein
MLLFIPELLVKIYEVVFSLKTNLFTGGFQIKQLCSVNWKVNQTLNTDYIKIWFFAWYYIAVILKGEENV